MPSVGFPTFDQLQVFSAVAEAGNFSAAARRLGRAQSVVSYTVGQLEQQLVVRPKRMIHPFGQVGPPA